MNSPPTPPSPIIPKPPSNSLDWRLMVVQLVAIAALTAITFKFGLAAVGFTTTAIVGVFGTSFGMAQMRGRFIPPGHTIVPPGYSVTPPPPAGAPAPPFRAPLPSHTGFSDAPHGANEGPATMRETPAAIAASERIEVDLIYTEASEPMRPSQPSLPPSKPTPQGTNKK
jgi:hypothetical protein